ncbi:hypothetical protein GW17_00012136 [Ensete ventricosum]|nr:hypothetical protein GW17_00012136 [Ensete ventricosum]
MCARCQTLNSRPESGPDLNDPPAGMFVRVMESVYDLGFAVRSGAQARFLCRDGFGFNDSATARLANPVRHETADQS